MWEKMALLAHYARITAWSDWRTKLVVISVLIAIAATSAIWIWVPASTDVKTFMGAAFASWTSGLLLFVLTGLMIGLVALSRPEHELFEARARNLLQRQTGPHINYIVNKLHSVLEPYVEELRREMTVVEYVPDSSMFLVNQDTEVRFRGYLPDMPMIFNATVGYTNASPAPPGRPKSCLTYVKIDGETVSGGIEEFEDSLIREFPVKVPPKATATVKHRMTFWVRASDEPNRQRTKRFMRKLSVTVHNQLPTMAISVRHPEQANLDHIIGPGEVVQVVNGRELEPDPTEQSFDFHFRLAPA